eukprot:CAMPEP_0113866666 /NCGR_PEP_ID=MMETSP0372-20130328/19277_1 /TAXON_ID=340204 /ORGANISM="Lankesteria abbotti" /LENGTH=129 /DNA_ID=CAMNT_0000851521 /DNA_START=971 /DNA_END=1356 /DNA_ORIENTATION=+ /assembly_acc=CAM_ASM_000359
MRRQQREEQTGAKSTGIHTTGIEKNHHKTIGKLRLCGGASPVDIPVEFWQAHFDFCRVHGVHCLEFAVQHALRLIANACFAEAAVTLEPFTPLKEIVCQVLFDMGGVDSAAKIARTMNVELFEIVARHT